MLTLVSRWNVSTPHENVWSDSDVRKLTKSAPPLLSLSLSLLLCLWMYLYLLSFLFLSPPIPLIPTLLHYTCIPGQLSIIAINLVEEVVYIIGVGRSRAPMIQITFILSLLHPWCDLNRGGMVANKPISWNPRDWFGSTGASTMV